MTEQTSPRVRFAPSPTGYLHVGGLRTALYNYLFVRKAGGTFVLRIEDTDRTRIVEGAVDNLLKTLAWAGLNFDEGPGKGGERGPYVQSERLEIYRRHTDILLSARHAYPCFCPTKRLDAMRRQQEKMRVPPKYDRHCLRLEHSEVARLLEAGTPHVVRMKVPESETIRVPDLIRGNVEFVSDRLDDQVIVKSDGYPTYHLANVVDDHLMGITHVIRGEEWLPSTPKHLLLYRCFGWTEPRFAHLPLLLNADRSKLSKRQGDVAVEDYRAAGYLPEALVNFVALLGWNPGDEREIFTPEELIREFSLERVGKSGAIFNVEKLKWINQQHLRNLPVGTLLGKVKPALLADGIDYRDDEYLARVISTMKDRLSSVGDFTSFTIYFFRDPGDYDETALRKNWGEHSGAHLKALAGRIGAMDEFTDQALERTLKELAAELKIPPGKIIHAARLALSGISIGPGLYEMMAVLGKETVLRRLGYAVERLG
ncbi:MAG TPA: glutamate--tRNA ligase [Bacteroidota bacterium]|nr:glutamate--tRNA ligase [Bacteroidota bacterium]